MKIKYKFIIFFAFIFTVSLSCLSYLGIHLFKKDKIAYVYSSMLESSQTASLILSSELQSQRALFEFIISNFDFLNKVIPAKNKANLQLSESVQYIRIEEWNGSEFITLDFLGSIDEEVSSLLPSLLTNAETSLAFFPHQKNIFGIARRFEMKGFGSEQFRVLVVLKRNPFAQILNQRKFFDLFLVSEKGFIAQKPDNYSNKNEKEILKTFFKDAKGQLSAQFTKEVSVHAATNSSAESFMVTWSPLGYSQLGFVSVLKMDKALAAITKMQQISVAILCLLLGIGLSLVLFITTRLTLNLESLTGLMRKFSEGDLEARSVIKSNDEVGILAKVFNQMTEKIKQLIAETKEKARMESELETARTVQQRLIPAQNYFESTHGNILGYYEPASECGGDWWYYFAEKQYVYFMIADVTGHGVPSALITSALRAAVASMAKQDKSDLSDYVATINAVIADSAKGAINATFFVGRYSAETRVIEYVNASHTAPFVINQSGENVRFLDEVSGERLGEKSDVNYQVFKMTLESADVIFAYTDGLSEFQNHEKRMFGEKRILKLLKKALKEGKALDSYQKVLMADFVEYKQDLPLDDDLTFLFFQTK